MKAALTEKSTKKSAKKEKQVQEIDFNTLFEASPCLNMVLLPDKNFTIVAVTDAYNKATMTTRQEIVGRGLFDVFPANPNDLRADGVPNLRNSLNMVLKTKKPHKMERQQYDIQKPAIEGGGWEIRYWDPRNTPVLNEKGQIKYIIHTAVDITKEVMALKRTKVLENLEKESSKKLKESEDHFLHLTQGVKDYAIFMLDTMGNVISWNKGAERIKGYSSDEIIGKNMSVFYLDADIKEGVPAFNLQMALKNGTYETEGWRKRKDRSVFWAGVTYTVLYDDKGIPAGFTKITRDLTARKKHEEEIKRANSFLDSVLENIPNMVFVKDANELRFVRFNKAGEELLGYSRNELLGKSDYDFFPKEQADTFTSKDKEVLECNKVYDIPQEPVKTKHGERWLHTRKIPIKDANGKPLYLLGISEDITERKEYDEQVKQLNYDLTRSINELELANKELESFSYSVSHDLRAPLRAIRGYTKILMEDYNDSLAEDAKKMMNSVANNAERMSQLIDDLLAFSRMGKKEITISKVNMTQTAQKALQGVKFANNNYLKGKVIIKDLLPAMADQSLVENVFTNLLSNAVKYSAKKENPLIEIDSYRNKEENVYSIKDNGVGFDMRYYNKLFGVFQRLHSYAEFEGTGVGLALVKRIVTRHGGNVWAEAEPGKGATFYFTLQSIN